MRIMDVQEFRTDQFENYRERRTSQFIKFLDKDVDFVTYFHINKNLSTTEIGNNNIDSFIGKDSPVRYNQINNLPVYGMPVFDTRNDYDTDIMKPEIVSFIEDSFKLWVEQLNPDLRIFTVKCYKCIGSSTGFQYTDTSDLDVQVFVEMKDGHSFDEIWQLVKILPNGHNIPGTHHPVNYFFIDENNPTEENKYENLYNIDTKTWEKKTDSVKSDIPVLYVREISRFFTDAFDLLIGRYTRDMQYLKDALNMDYTKQDISEKECKEAVDRCLTQVRADMDSMRLADKLIHGFRLQAYDDNNFFHISINYMDDNDPRKSMNEAIYKTLDKFEYRERLKGLINEAQEFLDKVSPTGDGDSTNDDKKK